MRVYPRRPVKLIDTRRAMDNPALPAELTKCGKRYGPMWGMNGVAIKLIAWLLVLYIGLRWLISPQSTGYASWWKRRPGVWILRAMGAGIAGTALYALGYILLFKL
jgi:hypothetical protein